jgi:hypothetical protein
MTDGNKALFLEAFNFLIVVNNIAQTVQVALTVKNLFSHFDGIYDSETEAGGLVDSYL